MKKRTVILGIIALCICLAIFGYYYYLYRNNPLLAYKFRSRETKICEEKCRIILREDIKACTNCIASNPTSVYATYAYGKDTKRCLYKADLMSKSDDYYDFYVKDCDTNQYIFRWHPTAEEFKKNEGQEYSVMGNKGLLFDDLVGERAEGFELGP